MPKTHYDVLGVTRESTKQEIRSAYRKLVLQHHPDQSSDPASKDILISVVNAYEVLNDKGRRQIYDDSLDFEKERAKSRVREAEAKESRRKAAEEQAAAKAKAVRTTSRQAITADLLKLSKLFNTGRFEDAEQLATDILSRNKREAMPYSVLGNIARARGQFELALGRYAEALQCEPDNALYLRQYEDLLKTVPTDIKAAGRSSATGTSASMLGIGACVCACVYIVLSRETPIQTGISFVSTWTLGLVFTLFLSGLCVGVALCLGGKLDRFGAVTNSGQGKITPAMALGTIAVVNFWVAAVLYLILGASQNAFNFSTSRVVGCVAAAVLLTSLSAHFSYAISGLQVLEWGGNLTYVGAICGWMVSDSLR